MNQTYRDLFRLRLLLTAMVCALAVTMSLTLNPDALAWVIGGSLVVLLLNQPFGLGRWGNLRPSRQVLVYLAVDALVFTGFLHGLGAIFGGVVGAYYCFILLFGGITQRPWRAGLLGFYCFLCYLGLFLLQEFDVLTAKPAAGIEFPPSVKIVTVLMAAQIFLSVALVGAVVVRLFRRQGKRLSESEARYRGLFECSSDGMFILDLQGKIVAMNQALLKLVVDPAMPVLGENFMSFLSEESLDDAAAMYQNLLQGEAIIARDLPMTLKDGRQVVFEVSAAPLKVKEEIFGFVGVTREVSARRTQESRLARHSEALEQQAAEQTRELVEARNLYQNLFENAAVPLAWLARDGKILSANRKLAQLAGQDEAYLLGRNLLDWLSAAEDRRKIADCLEGLNLAEDSAGPLQATLRPAEGAPRAVELYVHLDPNRANVLLSAIDVSARKEIEREQSSLQGQLLQAEKMSLLGQLAAGVAHEVNNPLTAISYYAQNLAKSCGTGTIPPDAHDKLGKIEEASARIQRLLSRLLAYARPQEVQRERASLNLAAEQALDFCGHALERNPGIKLQREFASPLAAVHADPGQLHQVAVNLIMNALEAIGDGPGRLTVRTQNAGEAVELVVEDTGEGIHRRDLPNIFTPFFTTKSGGRGTGLGLAIVKRIVEDHGGKIRVESQVGRGSTFTVSLPKLEE